MSNITKKLSSLADIFSGFTFRSLPPENQHGTIIIVQPKDIDHSNRWLNYERALNVIDFQGNTKFFLRKGDILIVSKGKTTPVIPVGRPTGNVVPSSAFIVIRPKQLVDADFLVWYLQLPATQYYFQSTKTGTTVLNLAAKSIQETEISLPPMSMQKFIGKTYYLLMEKQKKQTELMNKYTLLLNSLYSKLTP
jgi:restriction endonuclease S subunit